MPSTSYKNTANYGAHNVEIMREPAILNNLQPVPPKLILTRFGVALDRICSSPPRLPKLSGENETATVQLAPTAKLAGQLVL